MQVVGWMTHPLLRPHVMEGLGTAYACVSECACLFVRERECVCVRMCGCVRERESVYMCVFVLERECVCICACCHRETLRVREHVC